MRYIALLLVLFFPGYIYAAGFATQSLFLSQSGVTEGQTVLIHAVVTNEATTTFAGTLVFTDDKTKIGATDVSLPPGGANTYSVSWTPAGGSHTVTAALMSQSGTNAGSEHETFYIEPRPEASSGALQAAASIESSASIQQQISNVSPQTAGIVAPVFTAIDSARGSAADVLDSELARTKEALSGTSPLPSGSADSITPPDPAGSAWYVVYTLYLYLLTVARFVIGSAGVFYPILAVAFLYLMWRLFKRFRRE